MTRSIEDLEKLAGIQIDEAKASFKELTDVKKKINALAKKNDMQAITKILKDLAKNDQGDFDAALQFLVQISK